MRQWKVHPRIAVGAALAALSLGPAAWAQPRGPEAPRPDESVSLQGNEAASWRADPHIKAFYELSKVTLGKGAAGVDVAAYERQSYAIFRAFGTSRRMDPEGMVDHLKAIPRQVVQIVKEDPSVLDSYDNFTVALFGPP